MAMHRLETIGFIVAALSCGLATQASAAGTVGVYNPTQASGDFDGDGRADHVHGAPTASSNSGAIEIMYADGSTASWDSGTSGIIPSISSTDLFGNALAAGDIDDDGYDDLVVGSPGATVGSDTSAGAIRVFYGSASGLGAGGDFFTQDSSGIAGVAETDDFFGEKLTIGDFDCDGYADVAIGTPREDIGSDTDAGGVNVLYGSATGLSSVNDFYGQDTGGVNGVAEDDDNFAGALVALNVDGDSSGGHDCDDLFLGVPGEDISSATDAGYANLLYGSSSGLSSSGDQSVYQGLSGIADSAESDDEFAATLMVVDTGDDYADLVAWVPGESQCGTNDVGFHTLVGSASGFSGSEFDCYEMGTGQRDAFDDYASCLKNEMHDCGEADCIEDLADAVCTLDSQACRPSSIPSTRPYPEETLVACDACGIARHEASATITTVPSCGACLWWLSHE